MNAEYIFKGKDNVIEFELLESGNNITQIRYDAISRMTLDFDGVIIDSDIIGEGPDEPLNWRENRRVKLALGSSLDDVASGVYGRVSHTVYSPDNLSGLVWGNLNLVVA